MTGILDYNAGNIKSVERALDAIGAPFIRSKNPKEIEKCDRLIFPGVGEAAYAMEQLKILGFTSFLRDWAAAGKRLLGICLGSQIIFEYSEEGDVECLGLLKGKIRHFKSAWKDLEDFSKSTASPMSAISLKVPHMGWNSVEKANGGSALFLGVKEKSDFYFVHSYLIEPEDEKIVKAYASYGCQVPACVESGSITAFQFHPEKSGENGLRLLKNFVADDLE